MSIRSEGGVNGALVSIALPSGSDTAMIVVQTSEKVGLTQPRNHCELTHTNYLSEANKEVMSCRTLETMLGCRDESQRVGPNFVRC